MNRITFALFILLLPAVCLGQEKYEVRWMVTKEKGIENLSFSSQIEAQAKADSLADFFAKSGHLEVQIIQLVDREVGVFSIDVGPRYFWKSIEVNNVPEQFRNQLGEPDMEYTGPYLWIEKVLEVAENSGYPFAEARLDSMEVFDKSLSGIVKFEPGPYIIWDSLQIDSESKTKGSYLQRLSGIEIGEAFSQKQFDQALSRIRRSPYFTVIGDPEIQFQLKSAKPVFQLQEKKINVFDGVIGFLPNENEPGKLLVTGEVDLQLYHLGGKGRDISLQWQRLNLQSQSLDLAFKESFVLRSALDFSARFSLLKQDSSFVNRAIAVDFGYRISPSGYLSFFTKRQAGDLIETGQDGEPTFLPAAIDYRWNHYGINGVWETLDDSIFPRRGFKVQGEFSAGNKRILENTAVPEDLYQDLEENSAQYQGWFKAEQNLMLSKNWGMYFSGAGGFVQNDHLFLNELFRIGGLKSIRGFNEKFFYAKRYGYLTLEQRLFFGQNSYLQAFADLGIVDNPYFSPKIDKPLAFGAGINLDTGGGLFSFVFALGKSNSQQFSFEYARIHFGYLARF